MSITAYIKNDLAARLRMDQEFPVQLTLDSIADHYNVSLTPVRTAVAELIDEGLLEKSPNRRLTAKASRKVRARTRRPQKLPEPPRDPFDVIANDLVLQSFQGKPVYLRVNATAKKYKVGLSAFNDILHRLAAHGILDHIPRHGWRLRPFRQEDLQAYIEVREVLEIKALELAWPKLDLHIVQRILDGNVLPKTPEEPLRSDNSLHEYLVTTANNPYIRIFFERHGRYFVQLFHCEGSNNRATAIETIRQHREILTAMLSQNLAAARIALSHHILHSHLVLNEVGKKEHGWTFTTSKQEEKA